MFKTTHSLCHAARICFVPAFTLVTGNGSSKATHYNQDEPTFVESELRVSKMWLGE